MGLREEEPGGGHRSKQESAPRGALETPRGADSLPPQVTGQYAVRVTISRLVKRDAKPTIAWQ